MDTKETTSSSIVVARSKGGYQKNRLEMPVWLLYSHRSNQLVFTKSWNIWYNHLRPPMERLDSKSSMHTKQPFLAMLQKMESGHKGNYHFIHFSRTFERRIPKEPSWNPSLISLFTLVKSTRVHKILINSIPWIATSNGKVGHQEFNAHDATFHFVNSTPILDP